MDIAVLDGATRVTTIVADSIEAAQALYPSMLCVARGSAEDLAAVDAPTQAAQQAVMAVTQRQARLALLAAGKLAAANAALNALPGPSGDAARIAWEYASEIRRDDPLVSSLGAVLGLDAAGLDALFAVAATL